MVAPRDSGAGHCQRRAPGLAEEKEFVQRQIENGQNRIQNFESHLVLAISMEAQSFTPTHMRIRMGGFRVAEGGGRTVGEGGWGHGKPESTESQRTNV